MTYNPEIHHRKSIRYKDYDYSLNGYYFITICTHKRHIYFEKEDVKQMIKGTWDNLPKKFSNIELDEFVVMPNHIHGIVIVGAPLVGALLGNIVGTFKSLITNTYIDGVKNKNWEPFNKKLLQRNFYEHVIRNEKSLNKIREYMVTNPIN